MWGAGWLIAGLVGLATVTLALPSNEARLADAEAIEARYVETLPGIKTGPASAAQRLRNSAVINAHLTRGGHLRLHAGSRIEIGSTLRVGSGGSIVGDPGANRPTIYLPAAAFNNRSDPGGRYARNAVGIDFSGDLAGPRQPSVGVRIENVRLLSEQRPGRWLHGIVGRNVTSCLIRNVELAGFPTAIGIALASARHCRLSDVYVHDFADDTAWRTLPQSTGIEIDNDLVGNIPSSDIDIDHFRIERLRVSGPLLGKWGYQTDGINILSSAVRIRIADGHISGVGEGIDTFGSDGTISHVSIDDSYIFGLKFIHGAARNRVSDVAITNAGLAGVIFSGSDQAARDTSANVLTGIRISNIDPAGTWKKHSTAAIMVSGRNMRRRAANNRVIGAQIDLGPNGQYGWLDQSTGIDNHGADIQVRGGRSLERKVLIMNGGGFVDIR